MKCSAAKCSAVKCSAVKCSAVKCSAVKCSAVKCSAVSLSASMYIVFYRLRGYYLLRGMRVSLLTAGIYTF